MTRVKLAPDLNATIRNLPEVKAAIHEVAAMVRAAAVQRASPHRRTGEYIQRLVIEDRDEHGSAVIAGAPYSNWVEYGTCSRRLPIAPTPCPGHPGKIGIHPQLIMHGALADVTR